MLFPACTQAWCSKYIICFISNKSPVSGHDRPTSKGILSPSAKAERWETTDLLKQHCFHKDNGTTEVALMAEYSKGMVSVFYWNKQRNSSRLCILYNDYNLMKLCSVNSLIFKKEKNHVTFYIISWHQNKPKSMKSVVHNVQYNINSVLGVYLFKRLTEY